MGNLGNYSFVGKENSSPFRQNVKASRFINLLDIHACNNSSPLLYLCINKCYSGIDLNQNILINTQTQNRFKIFIAHKRMINLFI